MLCMLRGTEKAHHTYLRLARCWEPVLSCVPVHQSFYAGFKQFKSLPYRLAARGRQPCSLDLSWTVAQERLELR
jgi:hypothetical protein